MVLGDTQLFSDSVSAKREKIERLLTALCSSTAGTYPMNREYGLSSEPLDYPLSVAQTMMAEDIYNKVEMYIPQCTIESVEFYYDEKNDALVPLIQYEIEDDESLDDDYESEEDEDYERD